MDWEREIQKGEGSCLPKESGWTKMSAAKMFSRLLKEGKNAITEFPFHRFLIRNMRGNCHISFRKKLTYQFF